MKKQFSIKPDQLSGMIFRASGKNPLKKGSATNEFVNMERNPILCGVRSDWEAASTKRSQRVTKKMASGKSTTKEQELSNQLVSLIKVN